MKLIERLEERFRKYFNKLNKYPTHGSPENERIKKELRIILSKIAKVTEDIKELVDVV